MDLLRLCGDWIKKYKGFNTFLILAIVISFASPGLIYQIAKTRIDKIIACSKSSEVTTLKRSPRALLDLIHLPTEYHPKYYNVVIEPNFETRTFSGQVSIMFEIKERCTPIILNSGNLHMVSAEVQDLDAETDPEMVQLNTENFPYVIVEKIDRCYFFQTKNLHMKIVFNGLLNETFHGLYYSSHKDENNSTSHIVATNFKPNYARYAFPCIDEPKIRAPITLNIKAPPTYTALSNFMLQATYRTDDEGTTVYNFVNDTFFMSTYEIAVVVTNMDHKKYKMHHYPHTFKIYATSAALNHSLHWAAECVRDMMKHYTEYFKMHYPLPKLDLVAIPDIQHDAVGSLGLITFKESQIMYTDKTHTSHAKQRTAGLIARELAHTWISSLARINWWDNLWLIEGLANFMQYRGLADIHEDWKMMEVFLIEQVHPVLALEATEDAFHLHQPVKHLEDIENSTNPYRYKKAASILGMLENYVGHNYFRTGFTKFKLKHKNGIMRDSKFFSEFKGRDRHSSGEIMEKFMTQKGYPLVTLNISGDYYELTQEPFSEDRHKVFKRNISTTHKNSTHGMHHRWSIPITYQHLQTDKISTAVFKHTDNKLTIFKSPNSLIKLNIGQAGYYRVNYPKSYWYQLIEYFPEMEVPDRMHMLEETFALAKANRTQYEVPLNLTKKLVNETHYNTLRVTFIILEELLTYLKSSPKAPDFRKYITSLINTAYQKYTWSITEHEHHMSRMARFVTISIACMVGHEECLNEAAAQLNAWLKAEPQTKTLSPELGDLIYINGMKNATEEMWDRLFSRYINESIPRTKLRYLRGLASVEKAQLVDKLFEHVNDPNRIVIQPKDYFTLLGFVSDHSYGASVVWDHLRNEQQKIQKDFGKDNLELAKLISTLSRRFTTETKLEELETYLRQYSHPDSKVLQEHNQAINNVKANIKWLSKYERDVEEWISHVKI